LEEGASAGDAALSNGMAGLGSAIFFLGIAYFLDFLLRVALYQMIKRASNKMFYRSDYKLLTPG
jgi:hypothetical protein